MVDPLADLEAKLSRYLRIRLGRQVEPVQVAPILSSDGKGVRKSARGNQGDVSEVVLDDRVGHDRSAVNQVVDVRPLQIHRSKRREEARYTIIGPGRHLGDSRVRPRSTDRDHVRERTADIDSDLPSTGHDGDAPR